MKPSAALSCSPSPTIWPAWPRTAGTNSRNSCARSVAIIHIPPVCMDDLTAIQRGLYPHLSLTDPVQIYNLANTNHRLDTVTRVLDEIDAGKDVAAAVKSVRNQITAVLKTA